MRSQATIDYILMLSMGLVITLSIAGIFTQFTGVFKSAQDRTKEIGDQTTAIIPKDVGLAFITKSTLLPIKYKDVYDVFSAIRDALETEKKKTNDSSKKTKIDNMIIELKKMNNRMADEDSYSKLLNVIDQVRLQLADMSNKVKVDSDIKNIPVVALGKVPDALNALGDKLNTFRPFVVGMEKVEKANNLISEVTEFQDAPRDVKSLDDMVDKINGYTPRLDSSLVDVAQVFAVYGPDVIPQLERDYVTGKLDPLKNDLTELKQKILCYPNLAGWMSYIDSLKPNVAVNPGEKQACYADMEGDLYDYTPSKNGNNPFVNPNDGTCPEPRDMTIAVKAVSDGFVFDFGGVKKFVPADNPEVSTESISSSCHDVCKLYLCLGVNVNSEFGDVSNTITYKLAVEEVVE